jgi:pimeloyl-ACP methyl ester carboxylesterase
MDAGKQLARSQDIFVKVGLVLQKRLQLASESFQARTGQAPDDSAAALPATLAAPASMQTALPYAVDFLQRSILFWDTLRQRGNAFMQMELDGGPKPTLHFDYEMVLDGREFERPVNYALLKILAPDDVTIDPGQRPYVIIDPRGGHGPGIGAFKDDSQVGVALRGGHPVYFVIFFVEPEPQQTLLDVCAAEQLFVKRVRALHPDSPKPAIVGNCQGGWAAMMLAASDPEDTGPIVINGAPMSYWGGAWREGEGDNPMRYAGGMLGGTWMSSLAADLGNGKFDGAHLVQNFENLNPANTFWDKYYQVFANIDTEPPRFLEFDRWWGGYYLLNRNEIEWITRNLFVGNKLWNGGVQSNSGKRFDLRDIQSPIVLFASMGDNITPPQQAFNWVADVYSSTEEIKARGQVIVGLVHEDIGHLGIFVSGKVARKEYSQIVSVLDAIELLRPGLHQMVITERKSEGGSTEYEVEFHEQRLEDLRTRLNRFQRIDEKPFASVAAVSEFNQHAYELFAQPLVQSMSNEWTAKLLREFHPLRFQRWAFSDANPWLWWLGPTAQAVKAHRHAVGPDDALRTAEKRNADFISASFDFSRAIRDAFTEAVFFSVYGNLFSMYLADKQKATKPDADAKTDARSLPLVQDALASITQGGFAAAFARIWHLMSPKGEPVPLANLTLGKQMLADYGHDLPALSMPQWRRISGEQEIIAHFEPEQALLTLPALLADPAERDKLLALLENMMADARIVILCHTQAQAAMLARIRAVLKTEPERKRRRAAVVQS